MRRKRAVPGETSLDLPSRIDGIDISWGLQRIGGNQRLFSKLLREFIQDHAATAQEINDRNTQKRPGVWRGAWHTP